MNSTFNESDPNATRLLIIDDDAKLAGLLRDYLEPLGYVIELVHNGKDGLQLALQGGYAAIILDVMLPGMNGLDVLREIRQQSSVLKPVEYQIVLALARAVGRVKTREQLLLEVAERDFEVFDRSIDVHVSSLRKKLGDDAKSPRYIETVRSAGYRLKKPGTE